MRTVHFLDGPMSGRSLALETVTRTFKVALPRAGTGRGAIYDYQIHALVHGAHVHHVATLPGSPDPIAQLLAAYFKE